MWDDRENGPMEKSMLPTNQLATLTMVGLLLVLGGFILMKFLNSDYARGRGRG
jgi:hypothetical protein